MKIYSFGETKNTGIIFETLKASDDWATTRASVAKPIGGSDGSYDYLGSSNYPVNPITAKKTFDLPAYSMFAGTGLGKIVSGFGTLYGSSSNFTQWAAVGDKIYIHDRLFTVTEVVDNTHLYIVGNPTTSSPATGSGAGNLYHPYYVIRESALDYDTLDLLLDMLHHLTICQGESKLWCQLRDGTYLWTPAKCVSFAAPEKIGTQMSIPVTLEFFCKDGLWYSESEHLHTFNSDGTYSAANAGNYPATLRVDAQAQAGAAMTVFQAIAGANTIYWTGSVAANKHLLVTSRPNTIKNDGTGDYSGVVYYGSATRYDPWLTLAANGNTTISTGVAGSVYSTVKFYWYDTYLL